MAAVLALACRAMRRVDGWFALLSMVGAMQVSGKTITFDTAATGSMPAGWIAAMTHTGGPPKWEVLRDETAPSKWNVLAQTSSDRTSGRFPLAIYENASLKDGELSVRCKAVSGKGDQACGLVWRYRDPGNYYIARANSLENNVVLYKVENGERQALAPKGLPSRAYGVKHPVPAGEWNELKIQFRKNVMTVFFNSEKLFEVEDSTFGEAGKVGLWTKADSVTYFDDFRFIGR